MPVNIGLIDNLFDGIWLSSFWFKDKRPHLNWTMGISTRMYKCYTQCIVNRDYHSVICILSYRDMYRIVSFMEQYLIVPWIVSYRSMNSIAPWSESWYTSLVLNHSQIHRLFKWTHVICCSSLTEILLT